MKNILTILRDDLAAIRSNVMTAVIVFGVLIIPLLFTTFNVLASWNPFGNTQRLQIAVASKDAGYESDLAPIKLNLGDEVLSQLSRNHDIDWIITDSNDAVEGTKSGQYYAGIVLPEDFSKDLLTFYVAGTEPTKLELYTNEKKNALSTTITTQGADGVVEKIDESFTQVVSSIGLGVVSELDQYLDRDQTQSAFDTVEERMRTVSARLDSASTTVRSLSSLLDSTVPLADGASNILAAAGEQSSALDDANGQSPLDSLDSILGGSTSSLDSALDSTAASYGAVRDRLDGLLGDADSLTSGTATTYRSMAQRVQEQSDAFSQLRSTLQAQADAAPAGLATTAYASVLAQIDSTIAQTNALHDSLQQTATDIESGRGNATDSRQRSKDAVDSAISAVESARSAYRNDLKPQLDALGTNVRAVAGGIDSVKQDLAGVRATMGSEGNAGSALTQARDSTARLADRLSEQSKRFADLERQLADARDSGDFKKLSEILSNDPTTLASRLTSPVAIDREAIFPVATFGVGMAPFYMTLSLWVGALIACVLVRTNAEKRYLGPASSFTRNEAYLGRFATFALIALGQSTFVVLSLLLFVQIGAAHPFLLLLSGWIISLVFMLMIYTLVISFDSAGKALSILLLVLQISGASGAYPLPLLPDWFHTISPWLPATYAVDALRSAIAGVYHGDIWRSLGMLLLFTIPTLILGLWLRRFMDGYHRRLQRAIESTKVMA
ncbi:MULTISPECIES: YhgE/Pip domain-containing protein [Corynebacterium]|uniref:YhgE/Pip domain-containing protein n=1 Tax=Corynebacterium TaxID=1716 RepID=UPI00257985DC|nr:MULTISPECIES: YhgE/Pip domain-containing protein [Corynebacterium]